METGRKGENVKRAGPATMDGSWDSGGISQQQVSPGEHGVSTPQQDSYPTPGFPVQSTRAERGTHITSDNENQWGLCPLGRDRSLLETQVPS